tara:strand:+ start:725 stop:1069 length:345 start_codon:yes stop_codon:yes gene_type:complete
MRYLITGSRATIKEELVREALAELNDKDTVSITGSSPAEDIAARLACETRAKLVHKQLDNLLHGTNSRIFTISKLLQETDCLVMFYKRKDQELSEMISKADELGVEVKEFIIYD